ncbi:MAG: GNAT family N-acetyltransferase [Alphaproteobacteria bacterium]|nr:GNAT family N-acetyltransferase [Alphaproteobacteria bacterium]
MGNTVKLGYAERLEEGAVVLKRLTPQDVGEDYLRWMNDPDVTHYLQARFETHTLDTLKAFIAGFDHVDRFAFGIHDRESDLRIGTFTLRVNPNHRFSSIGYLIGEKDYWRGSYAIDACRAGLDFIFFERLVRRVTEPTTENHLASNFNFKRLGFQLVAQIPDMFWGEGRYQAATYWSIGIEDWAAKRSRLVPEIPYPDRD